MGTEVYCEVKCTHTELLITRRGWFILIYEYRKMSDTRRTKSPNFNDSHLSLQLSLPNPLKLGGRLNKKDGLTRYGDSHVKDKTS